MKFLATVILIGLLVSCDGKKPASIGNTPWQIKMNSDYKDASKSPLKAKDLKTFSGLDFFPFDSTYVVTATLERQADAPWFNMKTSTDRLSKERIYAVASFTLNNVPYQLNIYQGEENMNTDGYKDYLFLPFLDNTNGETTYAGGRYIDLRIPASDTIQIDFNKAYSPLCAYNEKYSCPIVPRENYLDIDVKVGVKTWKKD